MLDLVRAFFHVSYFLNVLVGAIIAHLLRRVPSSALDVRDDPKLFDFGLATEFNPDYLKTGTYKLTGDTGTMRYMAPEGK